MNNLELNLFYEQIKNLKTKPKGQYDTSTFSVSYRYDISFGKMHVVSERILPDIRYPNAPYSYRLHIERNDNGRKFVEYTGVGSMARAVFKTLNAKERGR